MTSQTADRFKPFGTTIFAEMSRLAAEHNAVNLSQGFPDFDGPDFVKQAAVEAINQGHNQYARSPGEPILVEQIAARTGWQHHTIRGAVSGALKKKLGLKVEATRVRNSEGSAGATTVYRIID